MEKRGLRRETGSEHTERPNNATARKSATAAAFAISMRLRLCDGLRYAGAVVYCVPGDVTTRHTERAAVGIAIVGLPIGWEDSQAGRRTTGANRAPRQGQGQRYAQDLLETSGGARRQGQCEAVLAGRMEKWVKRLRLAGEPAL